MGVRRRSTLLAKALGDVHTRQVNMQMAVTHIAAACSWSARSQLKETGSAGSTFLPNEL